MEVRTYAIDDRPQKGHKKGCLVLVIIFVLLAIAGAILWGEDEEGLDYSKPIASITADQFLKAFDENGVKADETYNGEIIQVTGIIRSIDKDIMDDAYITLMGKDEYALISVQCYFDDEDEVAKISNLHRGSHVTVVGLCKGQTGNIILEKCILK